MMIKNLPEKDKKELDSAFKFCKSAKEQSRIQVIRLLSKGYSHKEVSQILGVSDAQIRKLVTIYFKKGITGLRLKPSPKNRAKLRDKQKQEVKKILDKYEKPSEAGIKVAEDKDYWSLETLRQLVKQRFKVEYKDQSSYRRLFHYCNYSYQRVEFQDRRRKSKKGKEFKKSFRIKLKKGAISMSW